MKKFIMIALFAFVPFMTAADSYEGMVLTEIPGLSESFAEDVAALDVAETITFRNHIVTISERTGRVALTLSADGVTLWADRDLLDVLNEVDLSGGLGDATAKKCVTKKMSILWGLFKWEKKECDDCP